MPTPVPKQQQQRRQAASNKQQAAEREATLGFTGRVAVLPEPQARSNKPDTAPCSGRRQASLPCRARFRSFAGPQQRSSPTGGCSQFRQLSLSHRVVVAQTRDARRLVRRACGVTIPAASVQQPSNFHPVFFFLFLLLCLLWCVSRSGDGRVRTSCHPVILSHNALRVIVRPPRASVLHGAGQADTG